MIFVIIFFNSQEKSTIQHETEIKINKKIMEIDAFSESHSTTSVDDGSRIENIQEFKSSFEQNGLLKLKKKISSCSVSNCYQDAVHTLPVNESKIIKKIFSEFNFSFVSNLILQ